MVIFSGNPVITARRLSDIFCALLKPLNSTSLSNMFLWSLLSCFICVHGECILKYFYSAFNKCVLPLLKKYFDESLGSLVSLLAIIMLSRICVAVI